MYSIFKYGDWGECYAAPGFHIRMIDYIGERILFRSISCECKYVIYSRIRYIM